MRHPSTARIARGARGEVTWVGLLLLGALVSGVYLAWVWGPIYILHLEVKQTVRQYMNQAVRDPNDEGLVARLASKLRSLDKTRVTNEAGEVVEIPTIVVEPRDI